MVRRGVPQTRQSSGKNRLKRMAGIRPRGDRTAAGTFPIKRLLEKTHLPRLQSTTRPERASLHLRDNSFGSGMPPAPGVVCGSRAARRPRPASCAVFRTGCRSRPASCAVSCAARRPRPASCAVLAQGAGRGEDRLSFLKAARAVRWRRRVTAARPGTRPARAPCCSLHGVCTKRQCALGDRAVAPLAAPDGPAPAIPIPAALFCVNLSWRIRNRNVLFCFLRKISH